MKNLRKIGLFITLIGLVLSLILYYFLDIDNSLGFLHSSIFWIIGMPVMCFGAILFSFSRKELKIGLFAKILLSLIILFWFVGVISLFIR